MIPSSSSLPIVEVCLGPTIRIAPGLPWRTACACCASQTPSPPTNWSSMITTSGLVSIAADAAGPLSVTVMAKVCRRTLSTGAYRDGRPVQNNSRGLRAWGEGVSTNR